MQGTSSVKFLCTKKIDVDTDENIYRLKLKQDTIEKKFSQTFNLKSRVEIMLGKCHNLYFNEEKHCFERKKNLFPLELETKENGKKQKTVSFSKYVKIIPKSKEPSSDIDSDDE
jgi:hypothetical protein